MARSLTQREDWTRDSGGCLTAWWQANSSRSLSGRKTKGHHGNDSDASSETTSTHEQIHSTGHESRLKRDLGCAREELVAELGAVLLGDRLEIGSEIESHASYLGHWIELLKELPEVLFQVLSEARQEADLICHVACPELAEAEAVATERR